MSQEQLAVKLAQMKDLSEMMIDLAYSSLLYDNEEIADHVIEMEKIVDKLHTEFELMVLELRDTRPVKGLLGLIRLALAAEELADAGAMMARIVKRGAQSHPVMQRVMEQAEETIVATEIVQNSVLCGKSLSELGLEDDIGMRIIAVRRGGDWTYNPSDTFTINPEDLIIARGYIEGRENLLTLTNPMHTHE